MTMSHEAAIAHALNSFDDQTIMEDEKAMEAAIRAYLDARGMVMVPKEPTQAMLDDVTAADKSEPFSDMTMSGVYGQMIAAAPDPFGEAP